MDKYARLSLGPIRKLLNKPNTISNAHSLQSASTAAASSGTDSRAVKNPGRKSVKKKPIEIPTRIERGPTDILKALAGTIGVDYTAPGYKFHDDPYLIPTSNLQKRVYALSQESGRKAAKWVREQNPELYYHKEAAPPVMAFLPDPTLANAPEVTEDTVQSFINLGLLSEAIKAYEALKIKAETSREIKQSLLELIAFHNEAEPLDEDLADERWYSLPTEANKVTWKSAGFAQQLFEELSPPDSRAYGAMIRGAAKYRNGDRAMQLFEEAVSKQIKLDTPTFNALITIVNVVREGVEIRRKLLEDLLFEMSAQGVRPDIGTLNDSLRTAGFIGNIKQSKDFQLQILAEFHRIGVKPSLGCYAELLTTFCRERGPKCAILVDIMEEIEGKEFSIQHPSDLIFFSKAMEVCRHHLQDLNMAIRVHQLLLKGRNYDLIQDSIRESIYYRNFMMLYINLAPIEEFFEVYNRIVPNIYVPEPAIMEEILKAVDLNGSINYIQQLFSDIIIFEYTNRENLLTVVLQVLNQGFPSRETEQHVKLGTDLANIAWRIYGILENQRQDTTNIIYWSGKMLSDLLSVLTKAEEIEKSNEVMKKLISPSQKIVGAVSLESLNSYLQAMMNSNNGAMCLACLQYTNEAGYPEVSQMAEKILSQVKLDAVQKARLNNIVGFDVSATSTTKTVSVGSA